MGNYFNTADEGFLWIESFTNREADARENKRVYRLERMEQLCRRFDDPQKKYALVHLAGTKGKGSTAAFTAALLTAEGERTGLYTSPHLSDYRERIQVWQGDKKGFVDDSLLIEIMEGIRDALESDLVLTAGLPTTFELLTLLGFIAFARTKCAWVVLETGLGGRLDATNVCSPRLTMITPIEKEHTRILGDTLDKIAGEKAGIIKGGVPLILAPQKEEALRVLVEKARDRSAPVTRLDQVLEGYSLDYPWEEKPKSPMEVRYRWREKGFPERVALTMIGPRQAENAAAALLAGRLLKPDLPKEILLKALAGAVLPGRSHIVSRTPLILLDGAHTPLSVEGIIQAFEALAPAGQPRVLIFGCARDKDARAMARVVKGRFDRVIISRPGTFKPCDLSELERLFAPCERRDIPSQAWELAREYAGDKGSLLITGSFYLAGEINDALP